MTPCHMADVHEPYDVPQPRIAKSIQAKSVKDNLSHIYLPWSIFLFLMVVGLPQPVKAGELFLEDTVINEDTLWQGTIEIRGVVMVSRSATLIIEPGTIIRFKKIDRNSDGIGDSEIRVLGRLIAQGTKDEPISFESAEQRPAPKDWSYVLIFAAGKKSLFRYCQFRHAFSGLQVHFSSVSLSDSLFINNYEGLRFGRARLRVEHNTFANNDTAIRFTRMEGPVVLTRNDIRNNGKGVFLVPSGQNITDFFEPDRGGVPWNTGRLQVSENNIYNNQEYELSLGEKQFWDLEVSNNWWGTTDERQIMKKIFDHCQDSSLGKALYNPIAETPFRNAGVRK